MSKSKEAEYTVVLNSNVSLRIRRMDTRSELGSLKLGRTQWFYAIVVSGKKMPLFSGTDLYTDGTLSIFEAALRVVQLHMPTDDFHIPEWFRREELTTAQLLWFLDTARPLAVYVNEVDADGYHVRTMIGELPGVYMLDEAGHETHFDRDGWPKYAVEVGDVSEGTQELIDAKMDVVDPENEGTVTYPNIQNSPFSE